ncbi:MAG: hypothetical protein GX589_07100, partial [Deltaproteobacteria bacterium]|nr:hypothetical protein [Deltaproteobacteria bacterium]
MAVHILAPALLALFTWSCCLPAESQERYDTPALEVPASPKAPWRSIEPEGDPLITAETKSTFSWVDVVLWIPNRIMDFLDIFRFDIGVGPSHGAVVRLSRYAQAGYREMSPASV